MKRLSRTILISEDEDGGAMIKVTHNEHTGTLQNSDFLIYPLYFFLLHISSQMNKNKIQEN